MSAHDMIFNKCWKIPKRACTMYSKLGEMTIKNVSFM